MQRPHSVPMQVVRRICSEAKSKVVEVEMELGHNSHLTFYAGDLSLLLYQSPAIDVRNPTCQH